MIRLLLLQYCVLCDNTSYNHANPGNGDSLLPNIGVSGNHLLHNMTSSRKYILRVDLEDFEGNTRYALYSQFAVGSEGDGFRLTVGGYSGTAGWCLYRNSAELFSYMGHIGKCGHMYVLHCVLCIH